MDEFARLLTGLEALFVKHGYTDPGQGVQFGHASAGNAHFVLTADFTQQREIDRFMAFTEDSVGSCRRRVERLVEGRARHRPRDGPVRVDASGATRRTR